MIGSAIEAERPAAQQCRRGLLRGLVGLLGAPLLPSLPVGRPEPYFRYVPSFEWLSPDRAPLPAWPVLQAAYSDWLRRQARGARR